MSAYEIARQKDDMVFTLSLILTLIGVLLISLGLMQQVWYQPFLAPSTGIIVFHVGAAVLASLLLFRNRWANFAFFFGLGLASALSCLLAASTVLDVLSAAYNLNREEANFYEHLALGPVLVMFVPLPIWLLAVKYL
jgi:hypothetical protein